jgi:hypothetical protein
MRADEQATDKRPTVASEQLIAKPISIKLTGGKSGGCASKAVEITSGDLRQVTESGLRVKQFTLTLPQKSAEGVVGRSRQGY